MINKNPDFGLLSKLRRFLILIKNDKGILLLFIYIIYTGKNRFISFSITDDIKNTKVCNILFEN